MKKLKYLIGRIKNMNFKKMFDTIDDIHTRSGKSKVFILFDMVICAFRYQSGYVDYLLFEMWNLNHKERKTVLTRGKNNIFVKYYNKKEYNHIFLNKNEFNERFKKYLNREYIILDNNKKEFNKFIKNKKLIFCKPINGTHGDNMEKINPKEFEGDLYDYLINKGFLFDKETIENYLLSLKVKPFVILTGNSGTGKTTVARLLADILYNMGYIEERKITEITPNSSNHCVKIKFEVVGVKMLSLEYAPIEFKD